MFSELRGPAVPGYFATVPEGIHGYPSCLNDGRQEMKHAGLEKKERVSS